MGGTMTEGDDTVTLRPSGASSTAAPPRLGTGDLLAGRYKIVRFLAEGGMGEVYEAEDLALGERVALKAIRPDIASDPRVIDRFKREIQLARRVTHPHACRIFDVGFHDDTVFLTMELLEGETLAARIRRGGPIPCDEALPLVEQMAAALAAAHEAGVVHRDFKSANVVIVKKPGHAPRAVVTDFGLARGATKSSDASVTGAGGIVGSPAYMAPEQVEGGHVTPATDVYALGVVLYEMMTGRVPFVGENPLQTAVLRLTETPASPRSHVPTLPRAWEAAILRCLARRASDRPATPLDVVVALGGSIGSGLGLAGRAAPKRRRARWVLAASGAIAIPILGAIVWSLAWRPSDPPATVEVDARDRAASGRRAVAVMGFKDLSGRAGTDWISRALVELLATELAAGEAMRVLPSESVSRTRRSLALAETEMYAADTLASLRQALGVELVVVGTYLASGGKIRLDLRVQDTATGETVATVVENGTESDLVGLVVRSSTRLRERLGLGALTADQVARTTAARPANTDALRLYSEGRAQLRAFECLAAREYLDRAVAADPKHAPARAALGETLNCLGYEALGFEEMERAISLAAGLPLRERLLIEATNHKFRGNGEQAAAIYRRLFEQDPTDVEAGLNLLHTAMKGPGSEESWAALRKLRELPPPAGTDLRLDYAEATLLHMKNDVNGALVIAQRAEGASRERKERAALAMILALEAKIFASMGEFERSIEAARASNVESVAVGDRDGVCMGNLYIARVEMVTGKLEDARRMLEETLAIARELGATRRIRAALSMLSEVAAREGALARAEDHMRERLVLEESIGDAAPRAKTLFTLGHLRRLRGDLAGARNRWRQAEEVLSSGAPGADGAAYVRHAVSLADAELRLVEGDLAGADAAAGDATRATPASDDLMQAWGDSLVLSRIALEQGRASEAEQILRASQTRLRPDQMERLADLAFSDVLLARALLDQGKVADARTVIDRASALAERSRFTQLQLQALAVDARVKLAAKQDAAATRSALERAARRAADTGFLCEEFELRLALGELVSKRDPEGGRQLLRELERAARARGFGLYVRKAALART